MSQAGEYTLLKAMGKEPNPKGLKITEIAPIDKKKVWVFPDGSKMTHTGDEYIEIEVMK